MKRNRTAKSKLRTHAYRKAIQSRGEKTSVKELFENYYSPISDPMTWILGIPLVIVFALIAYQFYSR